MQYRAKKDRVKWCIYIDPELVAQLDKLKDEEKIYKSDLIEKALRYYLRRFNDEEFIG